MFSVKRHIAGDYVGRLVDDENVIGHLQTTPRRGPDVSRGVGVSIHAIAGSEPGAIKFVSVGFDFRADV
jgi:hypothetical protein